MGLAGLVLAADQAVKWFVLHEAAALPYRIAAHCSNAAKVAAWLSTHPEVAWVNYPGLPDHPDRARAERYLRKGAGAIIGHQSDRPLEGAAVAA